MAVCDIQALLAANPCAASTSLQLLEAAKLQLLCDFKDWLINREGTMTCDIQELLDKNPCNANLNPQLMAAAQLQLLCDILEQIQILLPP